MDRTRADRPEDESILIVEDDPDARELLAALLAAHGYRVLSARHGIEALEQLAAARKVCLILLDLMLPLMDGWEFRAEQLRAPHLAEIPVVVVSAAHDVEATAESLGADGALKKPIEFRRLLALLREHCPDGSGDRGAAPLPADQC